MSSSTPLTKSGFKRKARQTYANDSEPCCAKCGLPQSQTKRVGLRKGELGPWQGKDLCSKCIGNSLPRKDSRRTISPTDPNQLINEAHARVEKQEGASSNQLEQSDIHVEPSDNCKEVLEYEVSDDDDGFAAIRVVKSK
jgi:hypothetical protein